MWATCTTPQESELSQERAADTRLRTLCSESSRTRGELEPPHRIASCDVGGAWERMDTREQTAANQDLPICSYMPAAARHPAAVARLARGSPVLTVVASLPFLA